MMDVVFIAAAIAFFALMLAYARACEALGHDHATDGEARRDN